MKENQILFNAEMVRALLDGRKTMTRRVMSADAAETLNFLVGDDGEQVTSETVGIKWGKAVDDDGKEGDAQWLAYLYDYPEEGVIEIGKGYGQPGDRLWVRETWQPHPDAGVEFPEGAEMNIYHVDNTMFRAPQSGRFVFDAPNIYIAKLWMDTDNSIYLKSGQIVQFSYVCQISYCTPTEE
jgi:hypothetical protein